MSVYDTQQYAHERILLFKKLLGMYKEVDNFTSTDVLNVLRSAICVFKKLVLFGLFK